MIVVGKPLDIPAERGRKLRSAEVWFAPDDQAVVPGYDLLCFNQCIHPVGGDGKPFLTIHVDLDKPEAELWAGLAKETQYEIRRCARTDSLNFVMNARADEAAVTQFLAFYRRFSRDKWLEQGDANCAWYEKGLRWFHASGGLMISAAMLPDGESVCMHTYLVDGVRARLINSASVFRHSDSGFRALVGRANRTLHWRDIQHFKTQGCRIYDLGGITTAPDDTISKFKSLFGGSPVTEFNFVYRGGSPQGRAALAGAARQPQTVDATS